MCRIHPLLQAFVHSARSLNLALCFDGQINKAKAAALGRVCLPRVSSASDGAQKNALWGVWSSTPGLVRPTRAMGPGPCVRRPAHLLGSGSATRVLPALRQGEARTAGLPGRQSVVYQALCLLRGSALSLGDGQGHRRGASSGLGDGQRAGQAVHARPTRPHANPWAEGHRHRRDLDPQRSRLSDRGQRPAPRPCDLVWRSGPQAGEHEAVLRLAVMDMWKAFYNATKQAAPNAAIRYDKFHVMRPLGEALDEVRQAEYARLKGQDRKFIKGQKYTLLSRRDNLSLKGRRALKTLLAAN